MVKKDNRHPTRTKGMSPDTLSPSFRMEKKLRGLLGYLYENKNQRFNIKEYHRITKIPRSTVYDMLNRLDNLGFLKRELGNNKIVEKGIVALEVSDGGVGNSRRECRKDANLSTHYHKFKLPISDKSKFLISKIKELNPERWDENKLHNLHQVIIKFWDATIVINPKQLIINLYDIITEDVDESDFKCLSKAIEYTKRLMQIGVITEGMILEEGHWARVESKLSDFLYEKVDNKYFLDLGNGKKFWIDHSYKREHETNDKVVSERIDNFLTDVANSDVNILDIDKITKALGFVTKIECSRLNKEIQERKNIESIVPDEKATYFG